MLRPKMHSVQFVDPQYVSAYSGISHEWATQLLKNRISDIALQVIDSALVYDADNKDLLYDKGIAYEYLKQFDKAYEYQKRYYNPSNAEQEDYIHHMRYLGFKGFRNRVDASYTAAFYDAHDETLSTIAHLYSIATVSYARVNPRNTYTGQISYKGIDGYHYGRDKEF